MDNFDKKELAQYALRRYERLSDLNLQITIDYLAAHRKDVSQLRSLIIQISIVSFGIVGFSIPLIGNSEIIQTQSYFLTGLILISISAIYGIWYIAIVLENSIIDAQNGWMKNKVEIREALENERFLIKNPDRYNEYEERRQKIEEKLKQGTPRAIKKDRYLFLLISLLTMGILSIILSLFKITIQI